MRRSYKREELLALQETGKKAVTEQQQEPWVEKILAALEFFADDFYEMEKNNNGQVKSRHRNADRRQRGARGVPKSWDRGLDHQACEVGQEQGVTAAGWSHNNNKGGGAAAVVERAEVDEEEEEEEEEDSEEDVDSFQPRAFAVEGEPDFASGPPQDGWEYLRRVRQVWEAAQCPKVKVAKIDPQKLMVEQTPYMPSIPSVQPCASHLLPSKEWETEFLVDFSNLRTASTNGSGSTTTIGGVLKLVDEELGSKMEISGYEGTVELQAEISGYPKDTAQTSQDVVDGLKIGGMLGASKDPKPPLLGILVRLDAVSRAALLRFHIAWLERVDGLPYERTLWLFALSVVIDKPLDAQTSAAFRALLRRCAILRATKVSADDEELHRLNLLITIAGHYFGQSEDLLG
ncbi:unnamed protein product [Sphagnum troendelagicum]|uniref:Gem-associated protein 2 n=1 Tax=Sphagnum troendelagicum TaxID=128251 RepID=A0ABP0UML8_9BRYO